MNLESQLSEVKEIEFNSLNSINSSNYIYKKAFIKEKFENIANQLRALNFEKIAINKMQHMNFNFLINSIINLKKITNTNSPFMRYIKYVKPYNIPNSKINKKKKAKLIFNKSSKITTKNDLLKLNKQIISFNQNKKNYRNFYYTRMCNIEFKKINSNITEKIILIQKYIRGYLSKKIVDENINNTIAKNIINNILIIQRSFRKFLLKKKSLDKVIIKIIKNERNTQSNKITDLFSLYHYRNLYKKHLIIKKIVILRYKSAILIQSQFKSFIIHKKVKEILKKERKSYILTYPFQAENVQIKIYKKKLTKYYIYDYFICPIRKYFITYINKKSFEPGEYYCHILVDNSVKIDKRYKFINKNNIVYNLITLGNYIPKRKKPKQIEIEIEKKNREIKIQKDKDKKINDEFENFYIYYYNNNENNNDNSNSLNSYSTNSEHDKNKLDYRNQLDDDDPDQVIDITNQIYKSSINNFYFKSNYKYRKDNSESDSKYNNLKTKNNLIQSKKRKLEENFKKKIDEDRMKKILQKFETLENENDGEEDEKASLHQSESLKYNNILDEISQKSNSIISNKSLKNIYSYSKMIDKIDFKNNHKKIKKEKSQNKKKNKNKIGSKNKNFNN